MNNMMNFENQLFLNDPEPFDFRKFARKIVDKGNNAILEQAQASTLEETHQKVRRKLSDTLNTHRTRHSPQFWKSIFSRGMKKMVINDSMREHFFGKDVLSDPNVRKEELRSIDISGPAIQDMYNIIGNVSSIKKIAVEPTNLYGDHALEEMLINLNLEHLEIRCSSRPCIFSKSNYTPVAWERFLGILMLYCRNIHSLHMTCECPKNLHMIATEMLHIILALPHVAYVHLKCNTIIGEIIHSSLPELLGIDIYLVGDRTDTTRVSFKDCWDFVHSVHIKRAQMHDVMQLERLELLEDLKLEVMDRAELGLSSLCLHEITRLHISGSPAAASGNGGIYYELQRGAMLQAVSDARLLRELHIVHCRIEFTELTGMLTRIAENLRHLEISAVGQAEPPQKRVVETLAVVSVRNPNLCEFEITDSVDKTLAIMLTWGTETLETYKDLFERLKEIREELKTNTQSLNPIALSDILIDFEPHPEVVEEMRNTYAAFLRLQERRAEEQRAQAVVEQKHLAGEPAEEEEELTEVDDDDEADEDEFNWWLDDDWVDAA